MVQLAVDELTELRILELADARALYELTDKSRDNLREWLPWLDITKSVSDSETFIEMGLQQNEANDGFHSGIWFNGNLAGIIGLHSIHWGNKSTTIGYWLGTEFQGKGIMTSACRALVNMVFRDLHLNRVEIRAATGNGKSRAIPERLGFVQEGCIRQAEWLYDHYVDHVVYGLLACEWNR